MSPRGVSTRGAAKYLGLTIIQFTTKLPELYTAGFPRPHAITGTYDLKKIDDWMDAPGGDVRARDASTVVSARLAGV